MKIMKYDECHGIIEDDDGHQISFYWDGGEDDYVYFEKVKDYERNKKLTPMSLPELYTFSKALVESDYWIWKKRGFCEV